MKYTNTLIAKQQYCFYPIKQKIHFTMPYSKKLASILLFIILKSTIVFSQIVDASPEIQTICSGGSATLTAVVTPGGPGSLPTTSYAISSVPYAPDPYTSGTAVTLTDDSQTGLLPIGFTFCFYGNSYTQFIIGSNNWIGFQAGETSTWVTAPIPNTSSLIAPRNTIMGAWQDINPGIGGTVKYALYGVAPFRRLSVSWRNVPTFSCGALYTSQISIYETTNIIETHFANKPICSTWNNGRAVHGLHNATGTLATVVPGRNNTTWTTTNETRRFTPNGIATYTINWYVLPSNTLVGTGSPITVTPPAGQPSTSYYASITGTSGCGSPLSSTDTVVVLQTTPAPPVVANITVCNGTTATLTASGSGPVYEWYNTPGGTLLGTGASYTTPALTTTTTYYVQTNAGGCIGAQTAVTVTVAPTIIVNAGVDDSICSGGNYTLGVTPSGAGYTYSWSAPGAPGFSTSVTPVVSPAATTTYSVIVSDALGCTGTNIVTITVGTPLILTATGTPANCSGACDGAGNVTASGSFGGYLYNWTTGATSSSVSSLCASTYTVTVTDLFGCNAQDTIQVLEPSPIALSISSINSNCNQPDGSATVVPSGGTGGYTYLWSNGQTTATAINLIPGSYCVTVTDINGCFDSVCVNVINTPGVTATITNTPVSCNGLCDGTATITASSGVLPYTYLWNNGQSTPIASGLCPGVYTCTITDANGCTNTASATITQPTIIIIDVIPPVTICVGQSTTLNASANGGHPLGGYTFNWTAPAFTGPSHTVTPVTTTTYTVTATDTAGCVSASPQTVTVIVNAPLSAVASPNVSICPGGSTTLTSVATGGDGTYVYSWMPGSGAASSFNVSPASTTNYTITITDGCTTTPATATVTVTVLPLPVISFSPNITSGCFPTCITFTDATTVSGGAVASWSWDLGDGTTSTLQNPATHCSYAAGTYDITLTATTTGGCSSTSTINNMITIYPQPVAQFIFGPQPTNTEAPIINFTDLSVDATNWSWNFGDATNLSQPNNSNQMNPSHMYADSGQYCVTLTVQSLGGCPDTTTNCLRIEPEYTCYIPNAFTPNGDDMNNVFAPKGQNIVEFTMRIFDRWGNMIFKSNSINDGWNGIVQNKSIVVQEDVYVYNIEIKDNLGLKHRYIGHVTVVK